MGIIAWLIVGLISGFIGSKIVNKSGEGLVRDMILGIIGALVGARQRDGGSRIPNVVAPINEWIVAKSFDSVADCEKRSEEDSKNAQDPQSLVSMTKQMNGMGAGPVWHSDDLLMEMINEHCIASDDPRLKGK